MATLRWHWTLKRGLAAAALLLGVVAIAGDPYRGTTVRIDTQELADIVDSKVDHVTVQELADWIVQGRSDYRLIDLRSPEEYAAYHIPTAENVPLAQLPTYGLGRNERIVLYSQGGIHSAQGWFLLRAQKYPGAYILFDGLDAWKDEVLYPVMPPATATAQERAAFERAAQVARFFGGGPRVLSAASDSGALLAAPVAPSAPAPGIAPPRPPAGGAAKPAGKKRKEGC
jgi:rhodanese-related sulfurtransferase